MMRAIPFAVVTRLFGRRDGSGSATSTARLRNAWISWRVRLGKPGLAIVLLVLLAAGIEWLAIVPARQDISDKQERLRVLGRLAAARLVPGSPSANNLVQSAFAPEASFPDQLDRLIQHASDNGLQLNDGLYTVTREAQGEIVCYEVTLPLRGSYPQTRRFLAAILDNEQGAAMLDVQFHRAKISEPVLEAVVHLAFYLRPST
jgi:hypothetical protein